MVKNCVTINIDFDNWKKFIEQSKKIDISASKRIRKFISDELNET